MARFWNVVAFEAGFDYVGHVPVEQPDLSGRISVTSTPPEYRADDGTFRYDYCNRAVQSGDRCGGDVSAAQPEGVMVLGKGRFEVAAR